MARDYHVDLGTGECSERELPRPASSPVPGRSGNAAREQALVRLRASADPVIKDLLLAVGLNED